MNNTNSLSDRFSDFVIRSLENDKKSIHILWDCCGNTYKQLGRRIIADDYSDPLAAIRKENIIDPSSVSAYDVFCSQVESGIINGSERNNLEIDLSMKLEGDSDYELYHIYVLFLIGKNGKVEFAHINIRKYTEAEAFSKGVLSVFSSDKAPQIFAKRITRMMNKFTDKEIAFIQFDVERFKLINDNYGVEVGDEILKFFSNSLNVILNDDQPFCRLTADVFMIVISFDEEDEILDFIHMIDSMLTGYNGIEYRLVFGVAIVEDRSMHTRRLGDNATLARQSVKGNALKNIGFYNGRLKTELYQQQTIEDDMTEAVIHNEFVMYLQPKHCISSGRIIGAEALARWIHHDRGIISPAEFIPIFEKNGFILKLDLLIWEKACKQIRDWIDAGIEPVPISINISREYLDSFDVVSKLLELINKYNFPINLLQLEITETVDTEGTSAVVRKMKDAGFTMLMDDFGSGYSSLNMLKTTQFDVLKIDRSFLSEFMESERGRKIIEHTISMSKDIGLDIIAEGVETNEQAQFLNRCGCDKAQGFYYSKPIPVDQFNKKLIEVNT